MKLYSYYRSSAAFRVRIALNLKGVPYEIIPVHLLRRGGEQFGEAYARTNPLSLIPSLDDGGQVLTQSLAIIEYLDERYPQPPLLPADPVSRAYVRSIALSIACDIHPLNNLRVLRYLKHEVGLSDEAKDAWYRHWIELGLGQLDRIVATGGRSGRYALGDQVTIADLTIVPQIFNAQRFGCDPAKAPTLNAIADRCIQLDAFARAQPSAQPDAE
ncbi:MAG TPA: maleylacetoacetate isomerase [Burkholderiaceae bacterium]|nr:maleylacetoacetate isomerase [Burkholderiaceae bacterium]